MPEVSRFSGVVIAMYYRDHAPPHFHAVYGEFRAAVSISSGEVSGDFPRRALANVQEWRILDQDELIVAWGRAQAGHPLTRIEPLE